MNLRPAPLLLLAVTAALFSADAFAQSPADRERIEAAFLLARGRAPSPAERAQWENGPTASVADLVARHRQQLENDPAAQRAVIVKAFADAFGRAPDAAEGAAAAAPDDARTYVALMRQHVRSLAADPDAYRQVLDRAYRRVIRRGVYDEEVAYWKAHDTLPFALLAGCIDNWARRNQPGLMVTTGAPTLSVHSDCLATVRLSRPIAEEARAAAGLATANTDYFSYASSRTVIAAGADDLVSNGRIHFAAAGAPDLVPAGAMN